MTAIHQALVVGSGTMGAGIAQVLLQAGLRVHLFDIDPEKCQQAETRILSRVGSDSDAGQRLSSVAQLSDAAEVELVIEATPERMAVKLEVLQQLDRELPTQVIFASNSSGLDIDALADATSRPERVLGWHFFNPPPKMPLVEIVPAAATSDEVVRSIAELAQQLDKVPIQVRNRPGFIVNRVLFPMINEAIYALHEGVASAQDIDRALKLGANHPIGPLALADFVGLDVTLDILRSFEERLGARHRPCPLLQEFVNAGRLGRKTAGGFFDYPD
ncbi:MAG: 3-hydroxyacyl-CoA dehydrogenase NAD-binding domain-containing protein [Candidatus Latescibacterota bacterium]|nr:3-hydroxyacyl-CoA dehydrogenase NAD-binding domain-containing protein [Candidatus Latescibacterota bacterium]